MVRGTSASDEPVSVDTGLVLLDVNELNALVFRICLAAMPWPFGGRLPFTSCSGDLFCKKISRRVWSSSFDFFVFSANESGGLLPISSSANWRYNYWKISIFFRCRDTELRIGANMQTKNGKFEQRIIKWKTESKNQMIKWGSTT